jgi:hypothetical protein
MISLLMCSPAPRPPVFRAWLRSAPISPTPPRRLRCVASINTSAARSVSIPTIVKTSNFPSWRNCASFSEIHPWSRWERWGWTISTTSRTETGRSKLALATELNRPIVLHSREAILDTLAILKHFDSVRAVFHSFTGTLDEAMKIIDAGFLLGFTGPITFKKNDALREAVKRTPKDRLLVETDAPYLTPEPMRKQKVNEPAMVVHTAEVVAQQWGVTVEEVDRVTTQNVERFFGWR